MARANRPGSAGAAGRGNRDSILAASARISPRALLDFLPLHRHRATSSTALSTRWRPKPRAPRPNSASVACPSSAVGGDSGAQRGLGALRPERQRGRRRRSRLRAPPRAVPRCRSLLPCSSASARRRRPDRPPIGWRGGARAAQEAGGCSRRTAVDGDVAAMWGVGAVVHLSRRRRRLAPADEEACRGEIRRCRLGCTPPSVSMVLAFGGGPDRRPVRPSRARVAMALIRLPLFRRIGQSDHLRNQVSLPATPPASPPPSARRWAACSSRSR